MNNMSYKKSIKPLFSILAITPTRSSTDLPNTVGNTARRDNGSLLYSEEHPVESQAYQQNPYSQQRLCWWESNYKEAAIFLEVFTSIKSLSDFSLKWHIHGRHF